MTVTSHKRVQGQLRSPAVVLVARLSLTKDSMLVQPHWPAECEVNVSLARTIGFQNKKSLVPCVETSATRVDACLLAVFHSAKSVLCETRSLS